MKTWLWLVCLLGLAVPASAQVQVLYGTNCYLSAGSGSPEGAVTGNVCDTYVDTSGADVYVKSSGSGNTGWSRVPRVDTANVFSTLQTISSAEPVLYLYESDQGSNLKRWRLDVNGQVLSVQTVDDAGSSVLSTAFQFDRSTSSTTSWWATTFANQVTAASSTEPVLNFLQSGAPTNQKYWRFDVASQTFRLQTVNDGYTVATDVFSTAYGSGVIAWNASMGPYTTNTFDLGGSTQIWRNIYAASINSTVFAKSTQTLYGGWLAVSKNAGNLAADVAVGATTIDFGQSMTANQFVVIRAADTGGTVREEYLKVTSLSSGTTYNVSRDLSNSNPTNQGWAWKSGTAYQVRGVSGDGWLELNAFDTPRMSIWKQGSAYNNSTEQIRIGYLTGMPNSSSGIGAYMGDASNYFRWDGSTLTLQSAAVLIDSNGISVGDGSTFSTYDTAKAVKFTRSTGFGYNQTGDHYGAYAISNGSTAQQLFYDNVVAGNTTANARAQTFITAAGWNQSAGGAATPTVQIELRSDPSVANINLVSQTLAAVNGDSTTFGTPSNYWMLSSNNATGEVLGVAGTTVSNINMYVAAQGARKVALQATTSGANGGQFAVFTKADGSNTMTQALAVDANQAAAFASSASFGSTIDATGYTGHAGTSGVGGSKFNIYYTGGNAQLWIDTSNVGNITISSDRRLKTDIHPLSAGLAAVLQLQPVSFTWRDPENDPRPQMGLIAQDVATVLPNIVTKTTLKGMRTPDGTYRIDYLQLIPMLVRAIQEQQVEIDHLKRKGR